MQVHRETLEEEATHVTDEARMVLPGVQTVLGFQLIAVFNQRFGDQLTGAEQRLHLGATVLVALAMALIMAPAALHRQAEPRSISPRFLRVASRLLLWGMVPLALGLCLDIYLVARVVIGGRGPAALIAVGLLAAFTVLWWVLPRSAALQRLTGGDAH